MGGKDAARWRRGAPRGRTSTLSGISSSSSSSSVSSSSPRYRRLACLEAPRGGDEEDVGARYAGSRVDAAVDGLRSWRGEGDRLMWAVCITSAIWVGIEDMVVMMVMVVVCTDVFDVRGLAGIETHAYVYVGFEDSLLLMSLNQVVC